MLVLKRAGMVIWEAVKAWWNDGGVRLGASIAFYSMFALAPLLVIAIAIAGAAFGEEAARGQIVGQIQALVGQQAAHAIQGMIEAAAQNTQSARASVLSFATLLLGASGVFVELRNAFNNIWEPPPKASSVSLFVRTRLMAFALVIAFGFLMIVSLLLSAVLAGITGYLSGLFPGLEALASIVDMLSSHPSAHAGVCRAHLLAAGPRPSARATLVGLCLLQCCSPSVSSSSGLYLGRASFASTFGAAGSFVVVIMWVYYASQILLVGAELTAVVERHAKQRARGEAGTRTAGA